MRIPYLTPQGWDGRSCLHWCGVSFAQVFVCLELGLFCLFVLWTIVGAIVGVHKARRARRLRVVSDVMES